MFGCALKLQGFGGFTAAQVANQHYHKSQANGGLTYYSTDIQFDTRKRTPEELILYFEMGKKGESRLVFIRGTVRAMEYDKKRLRPADAARHSPAEYAEEPRRAWFLLEGLELMEESQAAKLYTPRSDGGMRPLPEAIRESSRNNRFYFTDEALPSDDDLIKF